MPMASDDDIFGRYGRILAYGKDKTKKTWWACRAAEAGYNVILLDGDDGATITRQLPMEARKRILVVNLVNDTKKAAYARFMASFCKKDNHFQWDEQEKVSVTPATTRNPAHSYIIFQPSMFNGNDVIILDSWTALVASLLIQYADEQGVDLTSVEKEGDQFALLGFQQKFQDYVLNFIHKIQCHVIVIGHETIWERYKGVDDKKKGLKKTYIGSYVQPLSSSGPQAQKMGSHFSDILHFSRLSELAYQINAGGDDNFMCGSRHLEPKKHNWKDITPQLIFEKIGAPKPTGAKSLGAIWIGKGETALHSIAEKPPAELTAAVGASEPAKPQIIGGNLSLKERIALSKVG